MLNINSKWKIYITRVDKDGNEIESERAVHNKEYAYYGTASRVAHETYPWRDGYRTVVAVRDPWQEYTREVRCDICGTKHVVEESYTGYAHESHVYLFDVNIHNERGHRHYNKGYNHLCPNCITKIREFISSMEVD